MCRRPVHGRIGRRAARGLAHMDDTELLITDCEDPVTWHLEGRARGFYVGVYRPALDATSPISSPPPTARWLSRRTPAGG